MIGRIKKLKDSNNNYAYPITVSDAVYVESNKTLTEKLTEIGAGGSVVAGEGTTEHYKGLLSDFVTFDNNAYINLTLESGIYRVLDSNKPPQMNPPFTGVDFVLVHQKIFTSSNWAYQLVYPVDNSGKIYTRRVLCGSPYTDGRQGKWKYIGEDVQVSTATTKKMLSMGDSISAKWGGSVDYPTQPATTFPADPNGYQPHISNRLGIPVYSIAYGGAKMTRVASHEPWDSHSFHKLATTFTDFAQYDIITVAYGTNDAGWNLPLGTTDSTDPYTFYGAMNVGIEAIYTANPNVQLFFIAPPLRTDHANGTTTDQEDYNRIKVYGDAIRTICGKYDIPVFDGLKESGINLKNYATTLEGDKLHPSTAGHNLYGARIAEWLKRYI